MKKDKSTIIILLILIIVAIIGYFAFGNNLFNKYDKFKDLIVSTKSGKEIQTEYSAIKDANFFIKVPTEFTEMNTEEKWQKFKTGDIDKVYTNNDKTVSVLMDVSQNEISNFDMIAYKDDIIGELKENVILDSSEIIEVDKHNIVSIIYEDEYEYHHTLYFSEDVRLGTISFSISLDVKDEWLPVSNFVIESLYFK